MSSIRGEIVVAKTILCGSTYKRDRAAEFVRGVRSKLLDLLQSDLDTTEQVVPFQGKTFQLVIRGDD